MLLTLPLVSHPRSLSASFPAVPQEFYFHSFIIIIIIIIQEYSDATNCSKCKVVQNGEK